MNDPVTESRQNATPIADDVEVVETIEQANARRFGNYVKFFVGLFALVAILVALI